MAGARRISHWRDSGGLFDPVGKKWGSEGDFSDPKTVVGVFREAVHRSRDRVAERQSALHWSPSGDAAGPFVSMTWESYFDECQSFAKSLMSIGFDKGDATCVIAFNCKEWFFAFIGSIMAGGMVSGVYGTNSPETVEYQLNHCCAKVVMVDDKKQLDKLVEISASLEHVQAVVFTTSTVPSAPSALQGPGGREIPVYSYTAWKAQGAAVTQDQLAEKEDALNPEDTCCLVYTSGTTGKPKAVQISHTNFYVTCRSSLGDYAIKVGTILVNPDMDNRIVSFLPLSHILALSVDCLMMMHVPAGSVYFATPDALKGGITKTLVAVHPTFFVSVPRLFEKIYEKMQEMGRNNKGLKKMIATWAKKVTLQRNRNFLAGGNKKTPFGYGIAKKLWKKIHAALGLDECLNLVTGGAPMPLHVTEYFMSIDLVIVEGFGMSETTGGVTQNQNTANRIGSVGQATYGNEFRVDGESGELQIKGYSITKGYLHDEEKTRETFTSDGWLKTGDVGKIDEDGFVYITGRIKELIITAGGENIAPVPIEEAMKKRMPCISQCVVIGDKRKMLVMLITLQTVVDEKTGLPTEELEAETLAACQSCGSTAKTLTEVRKCDKFAAYIEAGRKEANEATVSRAQRVQKFSILPTDFSPETGELTPTLKLKRPVINKRFSDEIEALYA